MTVLWRIARRFGARGTIAALAGPLSMIAVIRDIAPTDAWLRIAAPLEALIGFAPLTAAVSWISQIHPALTRRRLLALRLASLRATGGLPPPPGATATPVLFQQPAEDVNHVRIDLTRYGETYFCAEKAPPDRSSPPTRPTTATPASPEP
jgi:hypothetical protein